MREYVPTPLDTVETAFRLLTTGPEPLALDCAELGHGLPARRVPLGELRSVLLHPSTGHDARDAALGELVRLARRHGGAWTVGLAGVLLPGLRAAAGNLARALPEDPADVDAEVLAGFVEALQRVTPHRRRLASFFTWAAFNRGRQLRRQVLATAARTESLEALGAVPAAPAPSGHPDLVLARAVALGVVTGEEAELIARTRLEGQPVGELAEARGLRADTLRHRRRRAERQLAHWLRTGELPARQPRTVARPGPGWSGPLPGSDRTRLLGGERAHRTAGRDGAGADGPGGTGATGRGGSGLDAAGCRGSVPSRGRRGLS